MLQKIQRQFNELGSLLKDGGWLAAGAAGLFLALCAVLLEGMALGLGFDDLGFVAQLNWGLFFCVLVAGTEVLLVLCALWQNQLPLSAVLTAACFCFALLLAGSSGTGNIYFSLGLCLPLYFALKWSFSEQRFPFGQPRIPMWVTLAAAGAMFAVFTALMGWASILRYRTYNATNFDLGLFAQMFEFLRRTGHAWTTLERNRLLTHFGVHCSPVYYLLLPFYMIAPRIETLLVLQAAAVGAGVFAVRGIAKELFGDSPRLVMAACVLYLFNPTIPQGCLFDFHENKLLAVFLLWAVYFMLRKKVAPLLLFSILTLSVKEDAAIYVVALGLFLLFAQKWENRKAQIITGIGMIVLSVIWFACAISIIRRYGTGEMVDRLRNFFIPGGDGGFLDVAKVVLSNLGYVIKQVFSQSKVEFLLWVFLPLGFAPFMIKKGSAWLLMLPLLVINLLSDYVYQHAVGYQYTYGSVTLAIVLAMLALKECKPSLRRGILTFAVAASVVCTVPLTGPRISFYRDVMRVNPERIAAVDKILAGLPMDAEITATTWFATHLYQREKVYMYPNYYALPKVTQYLVCKPEEVTDNLELFIEENGYVLVEEAAFVRVYEQFIEIS